MNWQVASLALFLLLFPGYSMLTVMRRHHKLALSMKDPLIFALVLAYSVLYLIGWIRLGESVGTVDIAWDRLMALATGDWPKEIGFYIGVLFFLVSYILIGVVGALVLGSLLGRLERPLANSRFGAKFRRITPLPRDDNGFDCLFRNYRAACFADPDGPEEEGGTGFSEGMKRFARRAADYFRGRTMIPPVALAASGGDTYRGELCWAPRARNPEADRAVILRNATLHRNREEAMRAANGLAVGSVYLPVTDTFRLEIPCVGRYTADPPREESEQEPVPV